MVPIRRQPPRHLHPTQQVLPEQVGGYLEILVQLQLNRNLVVVYLGIWEPLAHNLRLGLACFPLLAVSSSSSSSNHNHNNNRISALAEDSLVLWLLSHNLRIFFLELPLQVEEALKQGQREAGYLEGQVAPPLRRHKASLCLVGWVVRRQEADFCKYLLLMVFLLSHA